MIRFRRNGNAPDVHDTARSIATRRIAGPHHGIARRSEGPADPLYPSASAVARLRTRSGRLFPPLP